MRLHYMENESRGRLSLVDRELKQKQKSINYIDKDAFIIIKNFRESIDNITRRFDIVTMLEKQGLHDEAHDILRFQIVYAMSALDYFMHEIYSFGLIKIFKNENPKTCRYNEYKIPLKLVEKALYDAENIDNYLKDEFVEINSNHTFMSSSRIREVLNIISNEDEFAFVEKRLKEKNIIKNHIRLDNVLDNIYERRNKISHQTDLNHGDQSRNKISNEDVEYYIRVIIHLVEELYQLICINVERTNLD